MNIFQKRKCLNTRSKLDFINFIIKNDLFDEFTLHLLIESRDNLEDLINELTKDIEEDLSNERNEESNKLNKNCTLQKTE